MKKNILTAVIILTMLPLFAASAQENQPQDEPYIKNNKVGFNFFFGMNVMQMNNFNDSRQFGLNLIYHPIRFLSIEPGFYFNYSSGEKTVRTISSATMTEYENTSQIYGGSLGVFAYIPIKKVFNFYIGPRFAVSYGIREYEDKTAGRKAGKVDTLTWTVGGVVGAKVMITTQVGIFADFLIGYSNSSEEGTSYDSSTGAVIYTGDFTQEGVMAMIASVGVSFYIN